MSRHLERGAFAVSAAFLAAFFVYPLVRLLGRATVGADPGRIGDVLLGRAFLDTVAFTVGQAAVSTVLTFAIGVPVAAVLARYRFTGRTVVRGLITVPFVLPTVVVAGAFRALFDVLPGDLAGTTTAIVVAHVFFNVAVVVRLVGGFWSHLDPATEQAARVLGADRWRTFTSVTLPLLRPALAAAGAIVTLFTLTSFGVILLLGDGTHATIETEIWRYGVRRLELDVAAAIAIVQLLAVVALSAGATILERRTARRMHLVGRNERARPVTGRRDRLTLMAVLGPTLVFVLSPLAVLVSRSLERGRTWSLDAYRELAHRNDLLGTSPAATVWNSVEVALVSTAIAVVVGLLAAVAIVHGPPTAGRILDLGLLVPLGTSAVTLGFGLFIAFGEDPLSFRDEWWLLPVAHALVGVPFVIRSVAPVLRSVDPSVRASARTLGASPWALIRRVDVPIASRGLAVGAAFAFAVSIGEFGATAVLPRRADDLTAPRAIFRLLGTPGDVVRAQAFALAVTLLAIVLVAVVVIDRLRPPDGRGGW